MKEAAEAEFAALGGGDATPDPHLVPQDTLLLGFVPVVRPTPASQQLR